jgi:hypothetical protein
MGFVIGRERVNGHENVIGQLNRDDLLKTECAPLITILLAIRIRVLHADHNKITILRNPKKVRRKQSRLSVPVI